MTARTTTRGTVTMKPPALVWGLTGARVQVVMAGARTLPVLNALQRRCGIVTHCLSAKQWELTGAARGAAQRNALNASPQTCGTVTQKPTVRALVVTGVLMCARPAVLTVPPTRALLALPLMCGTVTRKTSAQQLAVNGVRTCTVTLGAQQTALSTLKPIAWQLVRTGAGRKKEGRAGVRNISARLTPVPSVNLGIAIQKPNAWV